MSTRIQHCKAAAGFPVEKDESWVVTGCGGEPSERWTVTKVDHGEKNTWFAVRIEELH